MKHMTSTAIMDMSAITYMNKPVTISLSGIISKPDIIITGVRGKNATAMGQNVLYVPVNGFLGNDILECDLSDGNLVRVTVSIIHDTSTPVAQTVRTQTRTTTMAGGHVPEQYWEIVSDSGPLYGPAPAPVPLQIERWRSGPLYVEEHLPELAFDGDPTTYFVTEGQESWIEWDLGQPCVVSEVNIIWGHASIPPRTFTLTVSPDRKRVSTIYQGTDSAEISRIKLPPGSPPLLTMKLTSHEPILVVSEIEVKGAPATPRGTATGAQAIIAYPSQIATPDSLVILDGSPAKGDITRYVWEQTTAPPVNIFNHGTAIASFVAPHISNPTTMGFSLTITDKSGQTSKANALVHIKSAPILDKKKKTKQEEGDR